MLLSDGIAALSPETWNPLASPHFPFADFEYLHALESSESVAPITGWTPLHIGVKNGESFQAATVLYEKRHSYGEYIFDWEWARAFQQHNLSYFPKLVSAIPFTPATGPKLLMSQPSDSLADALLREAKQVAETRNVSSLHFLFLDEKEIPAFERAGLTVRHSFQYHWENAGYATFDDFLSTLKSRKRKQILKERREVMIPDLAIETVPGAELTPEHAEIFFAFYTDTIEKMGAIRYLNINFFQKVFAAMKDRVFLIWAKYQGAPVAAALFYEKGDSLFGRYWGTSVDIKHLHFELCYYRGIEYAIAKKLRRFEAGAQGEHKFARGFRPQLTYSAHWIKHPGFREAIDRFIDVEKQAIASFFVELSAQSPYANP